LLPAPIPENEKQRLEALRCYGILDTEAYACMQPLTKLAADICDCPISLITLVDENRQWFYTNVGLEEVKETPRDVSFCGHVIFHQKTMVVNDTLKDERFCDNPLVTNDPYIKFYAAAPLINKDGFAIGTLCVIDYVAKDISEKQILLLERLRDVVVSRFESCHEAKLNSAETSLSKQSLCSPLLSTDILGIVLFNNEGEIIDSNQCFRSQWNIDDELLINNDPVALKEHLKNQVVAPDEYVNHSGEFSADIGAESIDIIHMKDGTVIERHDYPFIKDDEYIARVCLFRDITDRHAQAEKLSYQATHDLLTGLVNRFEFERRLDRIISENNNDKTEHVLCYMDLDNFKHINDDFGHASGDYLLQEVSKLLNSLIRKRDTLARIGGDEFGLLMEHCSLRQAKRVAKKLVTALAKIKVEIDGNKPDIGISIGIVHIDATYKDKTEILKQADEACYLAKKAGRNRICVA